MFRRSPSLLLRVLVLSTGLALQAAAAQNLPDLQTWLSRPISPGTVAYLVNYPLSDPLVGRLAAALRDPRSDVRAAAARVAFVLGANGLATVAGEALKTESDVEAAIEQARIVAYFSDSDPLPLDAWKRLGADSGAKVLFALAGDPRGSDLDARSGLGRTRAARQRALRGRVDERTERCPIRG